MFDPWQWSHTLVTVVCGPPLSGKTTYVKQNARRGDLIVDVDWLYAALSGQELHYTPEELLPFVTSARDAVYERLMRPSKVERAWIITSKPEAASQIVARLNAKRIDLSVAPTEAQLRRHARTVENKWVGFIHG